MIVLRTATAASFLALSASGALALTAEQVWEDFSDLLSIGGASVTTEDEVRSGDTLTVSDIAISMQMTDDQGDATTLIPQLTFTEQADGSVDIGFPATMTSTTVNAIEDTSVTVTVAFTQEGMEVTAFGEDEVTRYDFDADRLTMNMADLGTPSQQADGVPNMDMVATFEGIAGEYDMQSGDLRQIDSTSTIELISFQVQGSMPDDPSNIDMMITMSGVETTSQTTLPPEMSTTTMPGMIEAGMRAAGELTFSSATFDVSNDDPDAAFSFKQTNADGLLRYAMGEAGIDFAAESNDITMMIENPTVPIGTVAITMAENSMSMAVPMVPGPDPQGFGFGLRLVDLVVPDMVWSMFDPQGALPREPATFVLDMDGQATLSENIFDPAFADAGVAPGELNAITVNDLTLALAGATLSGDGAFTFTSNAMGVPQPSGTANLMLQGGNALLDGLVTLGLLPQEQAMGARMMIGLFAKPGDGEDTLVSTIEVQEDGAILANGQRIR